ncbi:hypothetical protein BK816_08580 [Boudabousia tangfeifanii]|uniref:EamA domain-containing protein n=2 Tax=Boudabousia tangfeifanii TaxID=1912795 RepID=A0A1D9MM05_9ACTO|nr:hypothetical protein BK816_08580 [Boudabousia tangfeifanii]
MLGFGSKKPWTAARYERHNKLMASLAIMFLCMIWGSTFPMTKGLLDHMDPMNYLAWRYDVAAIVGAIVFLPRLRRMSGREWFYGFSLGFIYCAGQILQTLGLQYIDASVSGFITVMYVVFTPILVWLFFRVKVGISDWISVVLAISGLAVLSLTGEGMSVGPGELLTLGGALSFGLHIVMMSRWAPRGDLIGMSVAQMVIMGVIFTVINAPHGFSAPTSVSDWAAILFMALVAGLFAMGLQGWAQTILSATSVAIMFSLEPLFSAMFSILFWGESLTSHLVWGGLLIILAMQVSALGPSFLRRRKAVVEKESILPETSAGLGQAFEDLVTGGLPTAVLENEDLLTGEGLTKSIAGIEGEPGPEVSRGITR